jgi:type VI secretion system secreted protein VgrG
MAQLTQDRRFAELKTPLGKDVLVLASFAAVEGLSELFEVNIEALSEEDDIDFDKAIGRSCTIRQTTYDHKIRYYSGILTVARQTGKTRDLFHYNLTLRPWLWLLGHSADCRIFLDKNVTEIIAEVFTKAGFTDFEFRTTRDYPRPCGRI